jgi:hypothetical protein
MQPSSTIGWGPKTAIASLRRHVDGRLPVALVTGDLSIPQDLDAELPALVVMRKPVAAGALQAWLARIKAAMDVGSPTARRS